MEQDICKGSALKKKQDFLLTFSFLQVFAGSLFLALMAQISFRIPLTPVPITLQSFAVALLALALGPKKAPFAVLAYLAEATMGLPVLAGGTVNPLWLMGPTAGYLIGFVLASYVTAYLLDNAKQQQLPIWKVASRFAVNEALILSCGFLGLTFMLGWKMAFLQGVLPFLPGACLKATMATSSYKPLESFRSYAAKLLG